MNTQQWQLINNRTESSSRYL